MGTESTPEALGWWKPKDVMNKEVGRVKKSKSGWVRKWFISQARNKEEKYRFVEEDSNNSSLELPEQIWSLEGSL